MAADLHLIATSVPLLLALTDAGADVTMCGSSPMSTDDDIVRWLGNHSEIRVLGSPDDDSSGSEEHQRETLRCRPQLIIDEADALIGLVYDEFSQLIDGIRAASVHTLTGVLRLRSMAERGRLRFPVLGVDGTPIKQVFDNRIGTGQSTVDALQRTTNFCLPGHCCVVAGYGFVGRGVAERIRALGGDVIVTETDPLRALDAVMDGFRLLPMTEAAELGELFVTATGTTKIITEAALTRMRDGVVLANAGHSPNEIDTEALRTLSVSAIPFLPMVTQYRDRTGRRRYLLCDGHPINTSAAAGHPPELMDISFAAQAAGIRYLAENYERLENDVYELPRDLQQEIARDKLATMGLRIDENTAEQDRYLRQVSRESDAVFDATEQV